MTIQHRVELLMCVCPIELQQRGNEATPFLRETQAGHQFQGERIPLKERIGSPLKHAKQAQAILGHTGLIGGRQGELQRM